MNGGKEEGSKGEKQNWKKLKQANFLLPFLFFPCFPYSFNYPRLATKNLPSLSNNT